MKFRRTARARRLRLFDLIPESIQVTLLQPGRGGALEPIPQLLVRRLFVEESISAFFRMEAEISRALDLPEVPALQPGASLTFEVAFASGVRRRFHGVVHEAETCLVPGSPGVRRHRIVASPRASMLMMVKSYSVFVSVTRRNLFEAVLNRYDLVQRPLPELSDYEILLAEDVVGDPRALELVVQYGETDLDFLARRAEYDGISGFFEHGAEHECLVLTDMPTRFRPCEGAGEVRFESSGVARNVFELTEKAVLAPDGYVVRGHDYERPDQPLDGVRSAKKALREWAHGGKPRAESTPTPTPEPTSPHMGGVYEFGWLRSKEEAEQLAQVRIEEVLCWQKVYQGRSTVLPFRAGGRTVLTDHPDHATAPHLPLLFTEVTHHVVLAGDGEAPGTYEYVNEFVAVRGDRPFRPKRTRPMPTMPNVVTATIQDRPFAVGVSRDAVLDDQGRYLIQFRFDTESSRTKARSCPVRMAQPFVGQREGLHFPLRPGTEVLISFVDGHPDRPVIVGAVPDALHPSVVNRSEAELHRLRSPNGATIEFGRRR
ncbi:MAG: type VI secretion system tip protein VgrG [Deltaproteobacteria bacterium]|nr:type VI secretion system tip protein VgrG [Deltaproteobacteria bacterium]